MVKNEQRRHNKKQEEEKIKNKYARQNDAHNNLPSTQNFVIIYSKSAGCKKFAV